MPPLEIDDELDEVGILSLAQQQMLTIYDAADLELAQRRGLPLTTRDEALARAAEAVGAKVWRRRDSRAVCVMTIT